MKTKEKTNEKKIQEEKPKGEKSKEEKSKEKKTKEKKTKEKKTQKEKTKEKERQAVPVEERDADFTVLMLGQRRTGKSSVLSSMITSMEKICTDTGFRFTADTATKILMRTKQSQLQYIFYAHKDDAEFSTMEGYRENEENADYAEYSVQTDADITYRFLLEQVRGQKTDARTFVIDFVDVRGESMTEDFSAEGQSVKDRIKQSAVWIIAIDSPALMEGRVKDGVGEYHKNVNLPEVIYNHIAAADTEIRGALKDGQPFTPRLVLFVPLKCEKYHDANQMQELNRRIQEGYRDLFTFFKEKKEYTVAITPILTLGGVVFDHYKTRTIQLPNGTEREIAITYGGSGPASMRTVPRFPMFRFRGENPEFSPRYCEQPLLYVLAYINLQSQMLEKKTKEKPLWEILFWAMVSLFFKSLGDLGGKGMEEILKALHSDPKLRQAITNVSERLKISGDGYKLVYDRLGLRKGQKSC